MVTRRTAHHKAVTRHTVNASHRIVARPAHHVAMAVRPHAKGARHPKAKPEPVYRYVVKPHQGRPHPVVIQLPASHTAAVKSPSSASFGPQTVARAVSSALQSLGSLVQTGGGGFGRRIVEEFPLTLLLLGIAAIVAGSVLSFSRFLANAEAG